MPLKYLGGAYYYVTSLAYRDNVKLHRYERYAKRGQVPLAIVATLALMFLVGMLFAAAWTGVVVASLCLVVLLVPLVGFELMLRKLVDKGALIRFSSSEGRILRNNVLFAGARALPERYQWQVLSCIDSSILRTFWGNGVSRRVIRQCVTLGLNDQNDFEEQFRVHCNGAIVTLRQQTQGAIDAAWERKAKVERS